MSLHRLQLLGSPVLTGPGGPVELPIKSQALLWHLAAQPHRAFTRNQLADLLWSECTVQEGRSRLRTLLSRLRLALPIWPLRLHADRVGWDLAAAITVDTSEFLALTDHGATADPRHSLQTAVRMWRGPFLEGFHPPCTPEYEQWLEQQRYWWEMRAKDVLLRLLEADVAQAAWDDVIGHAQVAMKIAPLEERFHRHLMLGYYCTGDRAMALEHYRICRELLRAELGVEPDPETTALHTAMIREQVPRPSRPSILAVSSTRLPEAMGTDEPALPPLVGREKQSAHLATALEDALAGKGRLVLLHGEIGIGKSRLVQEARLRLHRSGRGYRTALIGRCYETTAAMPYEPVCQALDALLPTIQWGELSVPDVWLAEVNRLLPEVATFRPDLPTPPSLDPEQQQRRLLAGLARFFQALPGPTLFVLEDLHWADAGTLQFLAYLLRQANVQRFAILATARSGELPPETARLLRELQREGRLEWQDVGPLDEGAVLSLVSSCIGYPHPALARAIHAETRGNPLFSVELVRAAAGDIKTGDADTSAYRVGEQIPLTVQEVIRGRVGRLLDSERSFLEALAIFPRGMPFHLVRQLCGMDENAAFRALDSLIRAGILSEAPGYASDLVAVVFADDLFRRVLAGSISQTRLAMMHQRAFDVSVNWAGPMPSLLQIEQLSFHATAGGLWEQALAWNRRGADAALKKFAYSKTVTLLKQNLECLDRLPQTVGRQQEAIDVRLQLAHVSWYAGESQIAEWIQPALKDVIALGDDSDRSRIYLLRGTNQLFRGELRQAVASLERALVTARRAQNDSLLAPGLRLLGLALLHSGDYERSERVLTAAIPYLSRASHYLDAVSARSAVCLVQGWRKDLRQGRERLLEISEESRQTGDLAATAQVLATATFLAYFGGRWEEVLEWSDTAGRLAREGGHAVSECRAGLFAGPAMAFLGDPEAGVAAQEQNIALIQRLGARFLLPYAYAAFGQVLAMAGRVAEAQEAARDGLKIATAGGNRGCGAMCLLTLAEAAATTGNAADATNYLSGALAGFSTIQNQVGLERCHTAQLR